MRGLRRDDDADRLSRLGLCSARGLGFCAAGWLALALFGLVVGVAPAVGAVGHGFLSSLSEAPMGTRMSEPASLVVDHATGDLFVCDPGLGVIDVFGSSGGFVSQFGEGLEGAAIAVDEADGYVYVANVAEDDVAVFKPDESAGYELLSEWSGENRPDDEAFNEVVGVAVDNSGSASDSAAGDVYVVDGGDGAVDVFKPRPEGPEEGLEGSFVRALAGPKLEAPNAVSIDAATGGVLVADSMKGTIYTYSSSGAFEEKLDGAGSPSGSFHGDEDEEGNVAGLAIDESTGDVYVAEAERHVVSQFSASGEWLGWITGVANAPFGEPRDVALGSVGDVYVADASAGLVDVFAAGVAVADAVTGKTSKVARTGATLNGVINGDGIAAKYRFEWGTTEAYGQSTPVVSSGTSEEQAVARLGELHAGTAYYYRVVGENENGHNYGIGREFTTPPAVESLGTDPARDITPAEATLTGSLTPGGFETHYYFEWGTGTVYGNQSPDPSADAGSGASPVSAETRLSALRPNTTYYYRLVGENSFGVTRGEGRTFTTSGPPRITNELATGIGHEAATLNAKVNPDQLETKYHFEYGETRTYGQEAPIGGGSIVAGETSVGVSAGLSGLRLGVTYHYRVVATNAAGTAYEPDQTLTTVAPAPIEAQYASEVNSSEATLNAQINPLGNDTRYYFQYGSESCQSNPSGCAEVPSPPGTDLGSGDADVPVSIKLTALKPQSTYYYRVLASNTLGTSEGAQGTFTTKAGESALVLPDGRAWEMVSPPNKHGAPIEGLTREGGVVLAAEDGNSITYVADGSVTEEPQGNRSPEQQQVLSTRTPNGWVTQDIATPNTSPEGVSPGSAPEYEFFTPDLSQALVEPWTLTPRAEPPLSPEATEATIYLRDNATDTYTPLVTEANTPHGTEFGHKLHLLAATPDLSHAILTSGVALTAPPSGPGLYEWSAGALRFVSILPTGAPANGEPELGFDGHVIAGAVSNDGSRVVWTVKDENSGGGHLYMRDVLTGETIQLDAAAHGVAEPSIGSARFQSANSDGSKVFFTDKQQLTANSSSEPGQGAGKSDLYECEIIEAAGRLACNVQDLTVADNEGEHAAVQGLLLGVSQEGTSAYLVAQGALADNENGNGEAPEPGKDNLYEIHDEAGEWSTTFIAGLSNEDKPEWEGNEHADSAFLTARVSPDGRYLAFMSAASPTGYDNTDQKSAKRDEEVYLYDSAAASLRCVSCDPTGERPTGVFDTVESGEGLGLVVDRRRVWEGHWLAGNIPGWTAQSLTSAINQSRYLSDSGRLFFDSPDDLVPQATNNKEDVYEYEPSGGGSCESPSDGCVALISGGSSPNESAFLEATPSGSDVFFLTTARLLPQDTDTAFDVYDARVCTQQSPCLIPPLPAPAGCSETAACRPAPAAAQAPISPEGTATASGSGNAQQSQAKQESKAIKTTSKPKPLTRAQKLAVTLKMCRRQHRKHKRVSCERNARKAYASKSKAKKAARLGERPSARDKR